MHANPYELAEIALDKRVDLHLRRKALQYLLETRIVQVIFEKGDGSEREMIATRLESHQPEFDKKTNRPKKERPEHLVPAVELLAGENQWRTINIRTLKRVNLSYQPPEGPDFSFDVV